MNFKDLSIGLQVMSVLVIIALFISFCWLAELENSVNLLFDLTSTITEWIHTATDLILYY